jgi:predicted nucleic acid-binding protein
MTTMAGDLSSPPDRVMLDTNVLLAATDAKRRGYGEAMMILNEWSVRGTSLCVSGQVLREYLAAATRPVESNGLGVPMPEALANVSSFRDRASLLPESGRVIDRLVNLLRDVKCAGKQIHDANVVATMLAHNVHAVVTMNLKDFARFEPYVNLIGI